MFLPEIFKIQEIGTGFLAIMAKSRAGEWIEDEFLGLKTLGTTSIISMLETVESYEIAVDPWQRSLLLKVIFVLL